MKIYGAVLLHGEFFNIDMYECGVGVRWITQCILPKQVVNRTQERADHCIACNVSLFINKIKVGKICIAEITSYDDVGIFS